MAQIVRLKGINNESDIFFYLAGRMEKTPIAKKVYQTAWDLIAVGKAKMAVRAIENFTTKLVSRLSPELHEYVLEKVDPLMLVDDPRFDAMSAKVMAIGIVNDMVENPLDYRSWLSPSQVSEVDAFTKERGKAKLRNMLESKGIRSSEMDREKVASELLRVAKDLVSADKTAGCEKLPEGKMRDMCEKKKKEARGMVSGTGSKVKKLKKMFYMLRDMEREVSQVKILAEKASEVDDWLLGSFDDDFFNDWIKDVKEAYKAVRKMAGHSGDFNL